MSNSGFSPLVCLGTAATGLLLLAYQLQPAPAPQVQRAPAALGATAKARPSSMQSAATALPVGSPPPIGAAGLSASYRDHLSDSALAVLNRERAKAAGPRHAAAFRVYVPSVPGDRVGGDLEEPDTLARAVAASAADGEVMLLCVGGSGAMRTGLNLVLNFRAMGLYHMLVLALERDVCTSLWDALPSLACVWWPRRLEAPRPASLYNTMFNKVALAFFEARKVLLERLVVKHRLNVLHLDADTIWFANPYPVLKTVYRDHAIVVQADNPFANAGILYVQNVAPGDSAAWVLEELNRRIDRFTYRPESVKELPSSGWSTPPHFANADEQANLNDIIASSLNGAPTFAAGVEFYEARFKKDKGSQEAAKRMQDGRWTRKQQQGDVAPARQRLVSLKPDHSLDKVVHLCKMDSWGAVSAAPLRVPGNASAPAASLLLAPEWLFSHFPYGIFFPAYRVCHAASWGWEGLSPLEQRLCMPGFRVPTVMVHMAGLRNGQWGRRGVMRAFGVWHEEADKVAPETWVSPRTERLLVAGPDMLRAGLASMSDFDAFAARLLLLGLLLGRRVVMPPLPKDARWAERAIEPRHLRAIEVGCGPDKQRVWLPMPHFKEPWCSGVDFLYEIDYRAVAPSIPPADVSHIAAASLRVAPESAAGALITMSDGATPPASRVLVLNAAGGGGGGGSPLGWLPIDDWKRNEWKGPFARRVRPALEAAGLENLRIVRDCMHSLATSRD